MFSKALDTNCYHLALAFLAVVIEKLLKMARRAYETPLLN